MIRSRRAIVWFLLSALVLAQALGLMHRVVHLPHGQEHAQEHHVHVDGWVAHLFAGHDDDSTCRLFDPLNLEGAACVPAIVLPAVAALFFLDTLQGDFVARWAALFDARGPPPLR